MLFGNEEQGAAVFVTIAVVTSGCAIDKFEAWVRGRMFRYSRM
jgi:hypothetical protein